MSENETPTAILSPILALLRSRAFILMVVTALIDALLAAVPDLRPMRDQLIGTVTGLAALLIAKMAVEDAVEKHADGKVEAARLMAAKPAPTSAERTGQG